MKSENATTGKGMCPMDQKCVVVCMTDRVSPTDNQKPLMLQEALFCPVLNWCMRAWMEKGIGRFFVVCHEAYHAQAAACFPAGAEAALGTPEAYQEDLEKFAGGCRIEEVREPLFPVGGTLRPFHSLAELAQLQQAAGEEIAGRHQSAGVTVLDPGHTYIDPRVAIGPGTVLLPGTILRGETVIGANCQIGPNTLIHCCQVGDGCEVNASQAYDSTLGRNVHVGPFAHIRPKCDVGDGCKVGAYVEIKNAVFGQDTKMSHLTYVGDADVGSRVNFGCGTITSNYDGFKKFRTVIGDDVFIGCNTNLVPPVTVGGGAYVAAGTTVSRDVEPDSLAIGRARQENKPGWAKKRREMHGK